MIFSGPPPLLAAGGALVCSKRFVSEDVRNVSDEVSWSGFTISGDGDVRLLCARVSLSKAMRSLASYKKIKKIRTEYLLLPKNLPAH